MPYSASIELLSGVLVTPLKRIRDERGAVMHALRSSEGAFQAFGEAYFSVVNFGVTKGWKLHTRMTMNLVVPSGEVEFFAFDEREGSPTFSQTGSIVLGEPRYARLTIPPGLWVAFAGRSQGENLVLNIANIEHDPGEGLNRDLGTGDIPSIPRRL